MSSKQRRPLDDPPSAASSSSSSEVEVENSDEEMSEEEEEKVKPKPKSVESEKSEEESEEEESEDDDDDDTESENEKDDVGKQKTETSIHKKKNPQPESSSEPEADDFTIKPIKEQSDTPMSKPVKRKLDSGNDSKPKKAKPSFVVSEKKPSINRLWSEQDEISILKGLIEFQSNLGKDPFAYQDKFHEFMKKSVHVDFSKTQLMDKVRRLKKKYYNNLKKSSDGEDPVLSKPHEYRSFQLSKNIWGNNSDKNNPIINAVDDNLVVDHGSNHEKEKSSGRRSAKKNKDSDKLVLGLVSDTKDLAKLKLNREEVVPSHGNEEDVAKLCPFLFNAFQSDSMLKGLSGFSVLKRNLSSVGISELEELDSEWKELHMAETELALRKLDLIREQTRMVLDAMKSSKP